MTERTVDSDHERATELRDAKIVAQTFLTQYPRCFHLLGADVVVLMVEGFVLRRVLVSMSRRPHGAGDVPVLLRFVADVFNEASHLSAARAVPDVLARSDAAAEYFGMTAACPGCYSPLVNGECPRDACRSVSGIRNGSEARR